MKPSTSSGPIHDEVSETHPILSAASIVLNVVKGGAVVRDQCDDCVSVHTVHRKISRIWDVLLNGSDVWHLDTGSVLGAATGCDV